MNNYNYLFASAQTLAKTFQYLPLEDVGYPFIVINDSYNGYIPTTTHNIGVDKYQVDVWCDKKGRTKCEELIQKLLDLVGDKVDFKTTSYTINIDTSTKQVLWRGILKITMRG